MSDYCPHCDDFSIDASRAGRMKRQETPKKPFKKNSGEKNSGPAKNKLK